MGGLGRDETGMLKRSSPQPEAYLERGQRGVLPPLVEVKPEGADDQASAVVNQRANVLLLQHRQRFSRSSLQSVGEASVVQAVARSLRHWQLLPTAKLPQQPGQCQ